MTYSSTSFCRCRCRCRCRCEAPCPAGWAVDAREGHLYHSRLCVLESETLGGPVWHEAARHRRMGQGRHRNHGLSRLNKQIGGWDAAPGWVRHNQRASLPLDSRRRTCMLGAVQNGAGSSSRRGLSLWSRAEKEARYDAVFERTWFSVLTGFGGLTGLTWFVDGLGLLGKLTKWDGANNNNRCNWQESLLVMWGD